MVTERSDALETSRQFRMLGIFWIVYGILAIAGAIWLVFFEPIATLMFGALLNRVPDPFSMMAAFHLLYTAGVIFSVVCGALGIAAGAMLAAGQPSGRLLVIVAAFCSLWNVPLGTTLGIYTLIVTLALAPGIGSRIFPASRTAPLNRQSAVTP